MRARRLFAIVVLPGLVMTGCVTTKFFHFDTRVPLIATSDPTTIYAKIGEEMGDSIGYVRKGDTLQSVGMRYTTYGRYDRTMECLIIHNGDTALVSARDFRTLKEP